MLLGNEGRKGQNSPNSMNYYCKQTQHQEFSVPSYTAFPGETVFALYSFFLDAVYGDILVKKGGLIHKTPAGRKHGLLKVSAYLFNFLA